MGMNETKGQAKAPKASEPMKPPWSEPEPKYELWKPDRLNPALAELNEDERNTMLIRRSVTSILNKLTPENFSTLSEKMKMLPIDTPAKMQQVVEIIHKKAILEWKFRALFAKICDHMRDVQIVNELGITKPFSLYLINHCETFFHDSLLEDFRMDRKKKEIKHLSQDIRETVMRDYKENEREVMRKSVGNCQFIGELFKVYLIHPKIIFLIFNRLLKANGDMAVDCICALFITIGHFYEEKINELPGIYFNKLESLLSNSELSLRIRFKIQDVLALKKNFWRPKRILELPKTLQQIDQDIIEEKRKQKLASSISHLNCTFKGHESKSTERFRVKFHSEWTKISIHYLKYSFEPKNKKNENQAKLPPKNHRDNEDPETIAPLEVAVPLENTVSEVLEEYTVEYLIPVSTIVEEISINAPKKLSPLAEKSKDVEEVAVPFENTVSEILEEYTADYLIPVSTTVEEISINAPKKLSPLAEKLNDVEELPEVVVQADLCQNSVENEEDTSIMKSTENLVVHHQKKYSIEFLKSIRNIHQCTKILNVNASLPEGTYSSCGEWGPLPKSILRIPAFKKAQLGSLQIPMRKPKNIPPPTVHLNLPIKNKSTPCSSTNAMIPPDSIVKAINSLKDEKKTEDLYKSVTNILSELTSENLDSLVENFKKLPIDNVSRLKGVVDLIYDKAINELDNCECYAEMCRMIRNLNVLDEESGKMQTFWILIVKKCQQQFELEMVEELNVNKKLEEIDICTDSEMKTELQSLFEQDMNEFNRKAVANCRLINELFRREVIIAMTILRCVSKLLESADDVSVECLCILLKNAGNQLKSKLRSAEKIKLASCFKKMKDISTNKKYDYKISSEIRSMLRDVICLNEYNWIFGSKKKGEPLDDKKIGKCNLKSNPEMAKSKSEEQMLWTDENLKKSNNGSSDLVNDEISNNGSEDLEILLKDPSSSELFKMLNVAFKQWTSNEKRPNWFESEKHKLTAEVLLGAVSELIEFVLKTGPQNADKCGQFFAHLINYGYIQSEVIFRGLGCFLHSVENQQISTEFEFILNPLLESGILKLDDLNIIFQSNSDVKSMKNEEKDTNELQNESKPKELMKNLLPNTQPNIPIGHQPAVIPLPSHFDPFSSVTSSMSDLSVRISENCDVKPKPTEQLITDLLLTQTPENFKPKTFKCQLKNIPFQKASELELAASCVIEMLEKNPALYEFYVKLCCSMMMLYAEKMAYWIVLMKACHAYIHQKVIPDSQCKKVSKQEVKEKKLKGFCRFFSLLVNRLNNQTANVSVQRIMKKLLDIGKIDYFCEIYDHLDRIEARFEKSLFESYIPALLSNNKLQKTFQNELKRVLEDYTNRFCTKTEPVKNNQKQDQAAVIKQSITSDCSKQNITEPSSIQSGINSTCLRNETPISSTTDFETHLSVENLPENVLANPNNTPKKKKKKKSNTTWVKNDDETCSISCDEINRTVVDVLNELQSHPNSFPQVAQKISNLPINTESQLNDVCLQIYTNALKDDKFAKPHVVLCEHLQNWSITNSKNKKEVTFKMAMTALLQWKCKTMKTEIEAIKQNDKPEEIPHYDLTGMVTGYYRFLREFLKSPVFGCGLKMFRVMRPLLLLDTIFDQDIMELLDDLLKILLKDLDSKLEILEKDLHSFGENNSEAEKLEKYNVMFEMIVLLREMIHFQKFSVQPSENRKITRGKDVDLFMKKEPVFIENTIRRFEKSHEEPEKLLVSVIESMCCSFHRQLEMEGLAYDINDEFSLAILLKIFGKKIPLFEFWCISIAVEFTKKSNFPPDILSKVFEYFFLYEILQFESFVQYKNFFVSKKVLEVIEILNEPPFKKYKLS